MKLITATLILESRISSIDLRYKSKDSNFLLGGFLYCLSKVQEQNSQNKLQILVGNKIPHKIKTHYPTKSHPSRVIKTLEESENLAELFGII